MDISETLRAHLRYLRYLLRHKWYVLVECWKRGLIWQGLSHDCSKFLPSEWFPYVEHFEGKMKHTVLKGKQENSGADVWFELAWLMHCKRNRHHPEHWVRQRADGSFFVAEMPKRYAVEMFCDWIGANKAQGGDGKGDLVAWYADNKDKIRMHDNTRAYIESRLEGLIRE